MASSMLGKSKVVADLTVLDNGDSIAAYLTSASGGLITSSAIGGKTRLDTDDVSSVLSGSAYAQGTNYGSVGLATRHDANTTLAVADGDTAPLQLDANGALKVSGTIVVDAAGDYATGSVHGASDIGIYGLTVRRDTRAVDAGVADGDYASFSVNAIGELYVHDADALAQLVLANTSLGTIITNTANTATNTNTTANVLTALSKAEDAAAASGDQGIQALAVRKDAQGSNVSADGDYSSLQTWSEGSLKVIDVANGSMLQQRQTLSASAAAVPAAPLVSRKSLMIQNAGNSSCWVGSATVTTTGATAGIEIGKGGFIELEVGPAVSVFAIAAGALDINVLEMG